MATKTVTKKLKALTLDSKFKILNEFYFEPCSNSNYAYIAKFFYNAYGRINSIKIFNLNKELVCEISKKELDELNTKTLSKQNTIALREKIEKGDTESIKLLFLYNCFF